jgi:tetratricopeptide (TPR) repeat protein
LIEGSTMQIRRRGLLALPCAAWSLSGCMTFVGAPQTQALQQGAPGGLPPNHRLDDVPFVAQTPFHCGPAALAMVLQHAGLAASPEALADAVFLPARQGALQDEMLAATRRGGAVAYTLAPSLESLCRELAAGHPVVVLQNLGLDLAPRWHYAVAIGYDLPASRMRLHSGLQAAEAIDMPLFERTWARGGHWAFVALPPGRLARTASEAQAQAAILAFERVGSAAAAAVAWRSMLRRWPLSWSAAMGQGNALATQGDWYSAARAFEAAAQHHNRAAAWHNLGVARLRLGQRAAAAQAAAKAVERAQSHDPEWLARAQTLAAATGPP